jgi:lipoprotein-anchoring transpeptidase ErfK/SrfK
MAMVLVRNELLRQGIAAARSGHKALARRRFRAVLRDNPGCVAALLWMAWVSDDPHARQAYADRAKAYAPDDHRVDAAIQSLQLCVLPRRLTGESVLGFLDTHRRWLFVLSGLSLVGALFVLIGMWAISATPEYVAALMPTYTRSAAVVVLPSPSLSGMQATARPDPAGTVPMTVTVAEIPMPYATSTERSTLSPPPMSTTMMQPSPSPSLAGTVGGPADMSIPDTPTPSTVPTVVPPTTLPTIVHPTLLPTVISTILPNMTPVFSSGGNELHWIDVDLTRQMLTAYEGEVAVRSTLASTGLANTPTPVGVYRIWIKLRYDDMTGPGYYLSDVPYTMYFHRGYGIHGTYWHNNFGNPMSHGCVNLPTSEAGWLFEWAEIGTLVNIHY